MQSHESALQQWLNNHDLTAHHLAQEIDVSPRAIYNLLSQNKDRFSREILTRVANYTALSLPQLINPSSTTQDRRSGDPRIDTMIRAICHHLHSPDAAARLRRYADENFACYSPLFEERHYDGSRVAAAAATSWDEMHRANVRSKSSKKTIISPLSTDWISADGDDRKSRQLLTILRAIKMQGQSVTYADTILILGLSKNLAELSLVEMPKIKTWWWCNHPRHLDNVRYDPDSTDQLRRELPREKKGGGNCELNRSGTVIY